MKYARELIQLATEQNNEDYLRRGYFLKGNKERLLGNLDEALKAYFTCAEVARKSKNLSGEADAYGAIGDTYSLANDHTNAMPYYRQAIAALRKLSNTKNLASALYNFGDDFLKVKMYDSALVYCTEAYHLFKKLKYQPGIGYSLGNIGVVYAAIGNTTLGEKNLNDAITILESGGDYYPVCGFLLTMANLFMIRGEIEKALQYAQKSLSLARQYKLKEQIADAALTLSQLYEKIGNVADAFGFYKTHIINRDSVNNLTSVRSMADLRTNFEVSKKQGEVNLLYREKENQQKLVLLLFTVLALTIIILGTLYWFYKSIASEKKRSEELLLNILPAETARQLKLNGKVEAVKFNDVTVLFTDFVEFSKRAEHIEPEQLVKSIDEYFKGFDMITTRYGLEKIKTIGDSYMCACGLPTPNPAHATNVLMAANDMMQLVKSKMNANDGLSHFNVRIGIHTGPVVAGIVGIKKWQYDIWGDTVNIASRMESNSVPGRINISESTWEMVKDSFETEYRGAIEVKNRGPLKMYFLV